MERKLRIKNSIILALFTIFLLYSAVAQVWNHDINIFIEVQENYLGLVVNSVVETYQNTGVATFEDIAMSMKENDIEALLKERKDEFWSNYIYQKVEEMALSTNKESINFIEQKIETN